MVNTVAHPAGSRDRRAKIAGADDQSWQCTTSTLASVTFSHSSAQSQKKLNLWWSSPRP